MNHFFANYCVCSSSCMRRCDRTYFEKCMFIHLSSCKMLIVSSFDYLDEYRQSMCHYRTHCCYSIPFRTIKPCCSVLFTCNPTITYPSSYRFTVQQIVSSDRISQSNSPSIPSRKIVHINNGLQASSTSFITAAEDDDDDGHVMTDIFR